MYIPSKKLAETIASKYGTPIFLTNTDTIKERVRILNDAFKDFNIKIFYAIKSNYNPHIVREVKAAGIYGIDAVSLFEVKLALELGYIPRQIIYTPSNASNEEIKKVGRFGVLQNLGSLSEITRYCEYFPNSEISVRISPEVGAGESDKINTGSLESKFGLELSDVKKAKDICKAKNVRIVGVHSHIGSGFYEASKFKKSVEAVCMVAMHLPDVRFLDFGGGFGVHYHPAKKAINLMKFARAMKPVLDRFSKESKNDIEIRIEPGKYIVSESTVLLARITTVKVKGGNTFVGLDTGLNHLIRPAMYGAYHHVVNLSRTTGTKKRVQVVGNICETCDVFNKGVDMVSPEEGDIVAILVTGGHGSAMSSNYNMHPFAAEVLIKNNKAILIKKRQSYINLMSLFTRYKS